MELAQAQKVAAEVVKRLTPYCKKIEVAGSIRRRKPFVKDIDLVLIPSDPWNLAHEIMGLGQGQLRQAWGEKLKRVSYNGVQVDIYYASEETWSTLLLIRTGSMESNIRLASLAKKRGWHLGANGDGLFDEKRQRVAGDTEQSIFQALGLEYKEPWERN
jgi:DNA polymerase/3'-5' exonuclease PolX